MTVRLAANQPYLFPYIGYFQLIRSVDVFVISDDLNYIRRGWITRNRILVSGEPRLFSVPIADASIFRKINDTRVSLDEYPRWHRRFFATVQRAYQRAPCYTAVKALLDGVFTESVSTIGELARSSVLTVCKYLDITTRIVETSTLYGLRDSCRDERIHGLCRREGADTYVNSIGGTKLYSKEEFAQKAISLKFLKSRDIVYGQFPKRPFVPSLSIIDVMMFNSVGDIQRMLDEYDLV